MKMSDMVMLATDFTPGDHDVICQRGKDSFEHVGNQRFRKCIDDHLSMYMSATTRQEKSSIVSKIYDEVRERASKPSGGFVKKDLLTRMWFQVSEKEARDKVGQALRDAIKIVRGTNSRRKNVEEGHSKSDALAGQKRKKIRTGAARDHDAAQLKGTSPADTTLKMALSSTRRFDPTAGNPSSTRSFLENQVSALGSFPISTGGLRGWEDADGNNMKSMLESVIEPLDSFTGQQNIDLTKLNRKRRLSLSEDPFGTAGRQQPSSLFDEQMEQMAQKRALQMIGNSEFGSGVPSFGALRRLSLFGDQFFQDSSQQGATASGRLDGAANLQSNAAGLLGLSSLGAHQFDFDVNNMTGAPTLPYRVHQEGSDALQQAHAAAPQQSIWDLEPTPLSGSQPAQQGVNRQRLG
mmetsp:Transcript_109101/g.163150  ORF Transcript_109101/g.163150 Transcript_109101/m.163150 type:complete len:407 (+) Transcript_109101:149-1369(+)